jgi:hypothetical protein
MNIEIHRYEKFYTVKHRQRTTIGDTIVELPCYQDLCEYIEALMKLVRLQMLEEVMIMREHYEEKAEFVTADSKANDIIPNLDDEYYCAGPDDNT